MTCRDHDLRYHFALEFLSPFSDEATFDFFGTVNRQNCRVCKSENRHDVTEHECDSQKVSVFCTLMKTKL